MNNTLATKVKSTPGAILVTSGRSEKEYSLWGGGGAGGGNRKRRINNTGKGPHRGTVSKTQRR